jgi:F0F1-type ATP synthase, subunit b
MSDINLVEIPIYIINFLVTFVLLYLLLYKPVSKFLAARKERIANSLEDAQTTRQAAESVLEDAKSELAATGEKSRQLTHEAIENAALDAERILDNAQDEASAIVSRAREQMKTERQAALERAYTELVSLAGELAARILVREISLEDNQKVIDAFFEEKTSQGKLESLPRAGTQNAEEQKS